MASAENGGSGGYRSAGVWKSVSKKGGVSSVESISASSNALKHRSWRNRLSARRMKEEEESEEKKEEEEKKKWRRRNESDGGCETAKIIWR